MRSRGPSMGAVRPLEPKALKAARRYLRIKTFAALNRTYKHWAQIFNNDSTLTSAILDRIMHHVDTVIIEGKSFRMKDEVEE